MFGFNTHASRSAKLVVINNNLMILMVLPPNTLYVYFRVYVHVPFLVMNKQLKITIIVQKQFIASSGRGVAERGSIILFVFSLHPETNSKCYKAREFQDNDVA